MKARYEDNEELLSVEKKLQGSIGNRLRNAFNKGWHAGYAEGLNEAFEKIANAVMTEKESEEENDVDATD